jgi:superfamily I DNA/RNA helicase
MEIEWFYFEFVERAYRKFKAAHMLMDFTDLLERLIEQQERLPALEVLIVDEAQDLSRQQWKLVRALAEKADRTFVAGDDDQAVYTWSGADVESFLSCEGEVKILEQSYRVPAKVPLPCKLYRQANPEPAGENLGATARAGRDKLLQAIRAGGY